MNEFSVFLSLSCSNADTVTMVTNGPSSPELGRFDMIPAILIIGYERPENVDLILSSLEQYQNSIYLFIDLDEFHTSAMNALMIERAKSLTNRENLSIFIAEENYGVGGAVPAALNWVFNFEESVIVLEDDCVPNEFTIPYLSNMLLQTRHDKSIMLVSGSNPLSEARRDLESSLSSFPLIWGWAIWRDNWSRMAPYIQKDVRLPTILSKLISKPKKILAISFFTAAYLRSRSGITKAWDCNLALGMLLENYHGIVPNENTITNIGNDSVASHTKLKSDSPEIITASGRKPSEVIGTNIRIIDSVISTEIYNLRTRHLLSPLKAAIQILRNKAQNVFGVNR